MNRNERARDAVVERLVTEAKANWAGWPLRQQSSALTRICENGGLSAVEAMERIEGPGCPHCESTNMERGVTDHCRVCGGVSRDGRPL